MLVLPAGYAKKSVNSHNVNWMVLCDWIESNVLFGCGELSQMDIVDVLLEEEKYTKSDFAYECVQTAWSYLQDRINGIGIEGSAIQLKGRRIVLKETKWEKYPAHTFLLLLSLAPHYDWWVEDSYNDQGELFELVVESSFKMQFQEWQIYRTGWSKDKTVRLKDVVLEVATRLGEDIGDLDTWDTPQAKELGLDLLCYRSFSDNRRGIPVYMMQCSSGADMTSKLHTPDLNKWKDIIIFKNEPLKAFATPFSFVDDEYKRHICCVKGLFLERCRLLGAQTINPNWLEESLVTKLIGWCEPRIAKLQEKSL